MGTLRADACTELPRPARSPRPLGSLWGLPQRGHLLWGPGKPLTSLGLGLPAAPRGFTSADLGPEPVQEQLFTGNETIYTGARCHLADIA